VDELSERLLRVIDEYQVSYLKVDANMDVLFDDNGRSGHFWTRWSAGFERLFANLRRRHPELYLEHSASGLKRFWIGLPRLVHSTWLDDDISAEAVRPLLDSTDALLLPRQKTVLVTEDFADYAADPDVTPAAPGDRRPETIGELLALYWGGERRNGGALGISNRAERWTPEQRRAISLALDFWRRAVRDRRSQSR
jgi:hypothetical protein